MSIFIFVFFCAPQAVTASKSLTELNTKGNHVSASALAALTSAVAAKPQQLLRHASHEAIIAPKNTEFFEIMTHLQIERQSFSGRFSEML